MQVDQRDGSRCSVNNLFEDDSQPVRTGGNIAKVWFQRVLRGPPEAK